MSKVKKLCAYKGCDPNENSNETFFSFPSDPVRCQLWKDLSKTELVVPKYLCSKHFDKKKYISENPRRNILLHTAVPIPYEESELDTTYSDCPVENVIHLEEFDDEQTSNLKEDFVVINDKSLISNEPDTIYFSENVPISIVPCKRKSNTTIPVKIKRFQNEEVIDILIKSENNSNYNKEPNKLQKSISNNKTDEDNTTKIDSDSQITTFIFKGEEYVQMPKSLYLKEKSDLENKVQHYENIVIGIQNFLEKESEFKG